MKERLKRAKALAIPFCNHCVSSIKCGTDPKTGKSTHGCEECWVYWLQNSIIEGSDI
jgi:hypothetical protein